VLPSTRIMVVGDSLSHGYAGDWSWRFWVSRELHRQGVATDFVGPHRLPYRGTRYERAIPWDDDHAAAAGSTIDAHLGLIAGEMRRYKPDVLVVELGYNDLARGDDAATIVHQLQELVQRARLAFPTIRVLLSEITSTRSHEYDATAAAVNAQMSAWAPLNAVTMVNVMTGRGPGNLAWDPVRYTWDGLHPNAAGQTLFAQRVAEALQRAAVLPAAPALLFADRTWSPDARASVKVTNGRARVAWPTMTHELCVTGVRVLVDGVARTGWRVVPSLDTGVTLSLTPGDHVVQLVVRRGTMVSAPGGGVRVRA
jgi:lysophospholipase L1-like esterase